MYDRTEAPDPLALRDLLVDERKSSDVLRESIAAMLRAGWTPGRLLAEVPTLSEHQVREAMVLVSPPASARKPRRRARGPVKAGQSLGFSL